MMGTMHCNGDDGDGGGNGDAGDYGGDGDDGVDGIDDGGDDSGDDLDDDDLKQFAWLANITEWLVPSSSPSSLGSSSASLSFLRQWTDLTLLQEKEACQKIQIQIQKK